MTEELTLEARFKLLLKIHRASHFEWLKAVQRLSPGCDLQQLNRSYWDEVARDTAEAYCRVLQKDEPLAPQVASLMVRSSLAMGEAATLKEEGDHWVVEHTACPWWEWHQRQGMRELDRPGCDTWFKQVIHYLNVALGSHLQVTTACTIPDGASCCRRILEICSESKSK